MAADIWGCNARLLFEYSEEQKEELLRDQLFSPEMSSELLFEFLAPRDYRSLRHMKNVWLLFQLELVDGKPRCHFSSDYLYCPTSCGIIICVFRPG